MKKFKRQIENFVCEKCGKENIGNGYTDHCSNCLYSKHVDINPGDRQSKCGGLMRPVYVDMKGDKYRIYYKCEKCGYEHRVLASKDDNFEKILTLTGKPINSSLSH
ncbi:MAG: RNHCP domain-containing protein [Candidatus Dojkabacteria bacterium]|jgi:ribosomal protein L44E